PRSIPRWTRSCSALQSRRASTSSTTPSSERAMASPRLAPLWLALGIALLAAGMAVALMPGPASAPFRYNDKLLHALGFMGFMLWFCGLVRPRHTVWIALA